MKKMLMLASVPSMIGSFNMDNIDILINKGYEIHVACDFKDRSVWNAQKVQLLIKELKSKKIKCHQIDFTRKVTNLKRHIKSYKQIDKLLKQENFDFIHCHAPISGIIARLAAKKHDCKVIYTAHGFHFYKGAPIFNWIFYPFEKYCSKYTDILVTINNEDYKRASAKFHAKKVYKIPSVGLDNDKIHKAYIDKTTKRKEFNLNDDAFVILSVGELSKRKNQDVIIKAFAHIYDNNMYYFLVGVGSKHDEYAHLIHQLGVEKNVILLGHRDDVFELYYMSDVFVHPSIREGLGMAPLEAMAAGLPLISSNVNGINDYSSNHKTGYKYAPNDIDGFANGIMKLKNNPKLRYKMAEYNIEAAKKFDISITRKIMSEIYEMICDDNVK